MKELPIRDIKDLYEIEEEIRNIPASEIIYSISKEDIASMVKTIIELYESRYINSISSIAFRLATDYVEDMGVRGSYSKKKEMIDNILKDMTKYMLLNNIEVVEWDDTDEGKEVMKQYNDSAEENHFDPFNKNKRNNRIISNINYLFKKDK